MRQDVFRREVLSEQVTNRRFRVETRSFHLVPTRIQEFGSKLLQSRHGIGISFALPDQRGKLLPTRSDPNRAVDDLPSELVKRRPHVLVTPLRKLVAITDEVEFRITKNVDSILFE